MTDAKISDMQPLVDAISTELPNILTIAGNAIELIKQLKASAADPASATVFSPADQTMVNNMLGQLQQSKVAADNLQQALSDVLAPAAPPSTEPAPSTGEQPQPGGTDAPPATPAPNPATPSG